MADYIISKEEFKENLSAWLLKNDQKNAEFLFRNKERIPSMFRNTKQKLFRGISVSSEVIELLQANQFVTRKHTSWTKSEAVAKKFTSDPAYQISNDKTDTLHRVILFKAIRPAQQILDIQAFVSFMGIPQLEFLGYDETDLNSALKEEEVLISKELKILKNEFKILK